MLTMVTKFSQNTRVRSDLRKNSYDYLSDYNIKPMNRNYMTHVNAVFDIGS